MIKKSLILFLIYSCSVIAQENPLTLKWPYKKITKAIKGVSLKKNVKIAIIDTGIDYQNTLLRKNLYYYNKNNKKLLKANLTNFGIDTSTGRLSNKMPVDDHGHGTHIASIIGSFSKRFKIIPIKYYSKESSDEENLSATVSAIYKAIEPK